jgi:hypothetical protein
MVLTDTYKNDIFIIMKNNSIFYLGKTLIQNGLYTNQKYIYDTQIFAIIYTLWYQKYPISITKRRTYIICKKHIIQQHFTNEKYQLELIKKIIHNKADRIYKDFNYVCVDYITKNDIYQILEYGAGSIPKMNFLYMLRKYYNPRKNKNILKYHDNFYIEISSRLLKKWASTKTYIKYLKYFQKKNIIYRDHSYITKIKSKFNIGSCKKIKFINWKEDIYTNRLHNNNTICPISLSEALNIMFPIWENLSNILKELCYTSKQIYNIKKYLYTIQ